MILFQLSVTYMLDNMSVNNACEAMQAAVTYGQDELREKTLAYIEQNTSVSSGAWCVCVWGGFGALG